VLERLDDIDWGSLEHAYGPAVYLPAVPFLVEVLSGPPIATKAPIAELLSTMTSAHADDAMVGYEEDCSSV